MSEKLKKLAELATTLPEAYKDNATALVERMGEVISGLSDTDIVWKPSTLTLVQAISDYSKLPKGVTRGSLVLGESILDTPIKVIPLMTYTTRQKWSEDLDNNRPTCSSPDGDKGFRYGDCRACPHSKFDEEAKKSACNKTITVLTITEDLSQVFLINFSKTNYSSGMDWLSLMKKAGVHPYKRVYDLSSGTSSKTKNVEVIKVEPTTPDNKVGAEVLPFIEELFTQCRTDRKEVLVKFHEYLNSKKDASVLMLDVADSSQGEEGVTLIAAVDDISDVVPKGKATQYKL